MEEERLMFKAYQRSLLRSFCALKEALDHNNTEKMRGIIDGLIEDTRNNIAESLSSAD